MNSTLAVCYSILVTDLDAHVRRHYAASVHISSHHDLRSSEVSGL
jgi:hypothetical protein